MIQRLENQAVSREFQWALCPPVELRMSFSREGGFLEDGVVYQVPIGKRLVIKQITCMVQGSLNGYRLVVNAGSNRLTRRLSGHFREKLLVRFYAEQGTSVAIGVARSFPAGEWTGYLTASGYLTDSY